MSDETGPVIVVADDDEVFRSTLHEILSAEGYSVILAADGAHALQAVEKSHPRLVVLDWEMPGVDGAGFRRAQALTPAIADVPVLVLTGDSRALQDAKRSGVQRALVKPVVLAALLTAVEELCQAR